MKLIKAIEWFWYRILWILAIRPVHLDFELTTSCNLKCKYCFRQSEKWKNKNNVINNKHMNVIKAFNVLRQAKLLGFKSVKLNWRGEPTIHPHLESIIDFAYDMGFTDIILNTNLFRIPSNIGKVKTVKVSFDSANKIGFEHIRKGASFDETIKDLKVLNFMGVKPVVNARVKNEIEGVRIKKLMVESGINCCFDIRGLMPRNENYKAEIVNGRKYCKQPSRRIVVGVDGKVWPCCVAYHNPDEICLGNLQVNSLKEILNGERRKWIISKLKKGKWNEFETCKNCTSSEAYK